MATPQRRVLLVEDDPAIAVGLTWLLEDEGWLVDVAATGAAAILAIDRLTPDVMVLDVGLPDMEGTEVYEAIVSKLPNLSVVFSTGQLDRKQLDPYLQRPHVGYLLKPYESSALLRAIEQVIA